MYLAILGYLLVIVMMVGLLKNKLTPMVAFIILPIIFALLAGFSPAEIGGFVKEGVPKTLSASALALFATAYFAIMTDKGLFDPIVSWLSKKAGGNVVAIMIITVIIAAISHMDTGMTSTILVTIPAMPPSLQKVPDQAGVPLPAPGTVCRRGQPSSSWRRNDPHVQCIGS